MPRLLLTFIILTVGLVDTVSAQVFSGQVYVMTEQFSADGCKPQIECDCCSSDILFLTDKEFVMVDKCIYNDSYFRGTYMKTEEYLTLTFEQFVVNETYSDETEETKVEKQNFKIPAIKFYTTTCNGDNLILQRTDLKVLTKAFQESKEKADRAMKELKNTRAWGQLT